MSPLLLLVVFLVLDTISAGSGGEWHWAYEGDAGPVFWAGHHDNCAGNMQSPVDLPLSEVVYDPSHGPIQFNQYDANPSSVAYTLKNNGHAVQVDITGGDHSIQGGKLPAQYNLGQFHFHWGSENDVGSEHLINGQQYPLEMHLVHYQSRYGGIGGAKERHDGLAVVGVMFQVGAKPHPAMDKLVSRLNQIKHKDQTAPIDTFPLSDLLPEDKTSYFRYRGSLTTPTCDETVVWTVLNQPITISQSQIDAFRKVYQGEQGDQSNKMVDNFRPPQPLFGRTIYSSFEASSAHIPTFSLSVIILTLVVKYIL